MPRFELIEKLPRRPDPLSYRVRHPLPDTLLRPGERSRIQQLLIRLRVLPPPVFHSLIGHLSHLSSHDPARLIQNFLAQYEEISRSFSIVPKELSRNCMKTNILPLSSLKIIF